MSPGDTEDFDLLVVGAGHAGAEAALAAARMGARCGCVIMDPAAIGRMSCNPAIGGIAKGQLVRELDALGGEMGLCADTSGIQFRMINTRKGPAVRSPRAQCDRELYNREMVRRLQAQVGLEIVTGEAVEIMVAGKGERRRVVGVRLADGQELHASAVVLTTGTFLGGRLFAGAWEESGGRLGEAGASRLSRNLEALDLRLARHKTGTPPRLSAASIDFSILEEQPGDEFPQAFSFRTAALSQEQVCCHVTRSTAETHAIIGEAAHLSPMYQGRIKGLGPRYCPSIEDKVMRFPERDSHRIFLEPEGRDSDEIYPNGISTSLPVDVQRAFLRSIPGLEKVEMLRPGYAVEYDFLCTDQIRGDLQVAGLRGLFAAGQINGTSGYEEAAAQGLMAGINAVLHLRGEPAFILDRSSSYIGVMIDDLCRVNPREPYRMFTSRAEYRLLLRSANADRRLSAKGHALGLLPAEQMQRVAKKEARITAARELLAQTRREYRSLEELLRRPEEVIENFLPELSALGLSRDELSEVEAEIKYAGYIERQRRDVERLLRMEAKRIPRSFDYHALTGLSAEARERLLQRRPLTIGEAGRLAGVTPSDLNLLLAGMART